MSDLLRIKLSAVRRKSILVSAGTGACVAVGSIIASFGVEMCADWEWDLSFTLRAAWLAAALAMLIVLIVRQVIWPLFVFPDDEEVALWVEHQSPGLRSRLISAIQLTRPQAVPAGQSLALVSALVRQTEEITQPMDFMGVVKLDRLAQRGGLACFVFLLALFGMADGGSASVDLLKRAMLVPGINVPRKTRVQMITPDPLVVARGENVELRALASGVIPKTGSVIIRYDGEREPVSLPMAPDSANPTQFFLKLDTVSRSFAYRVVLNDGHGPDARVQASVRPSIVSLDIAEIYPSYTHLGSVKHSPGDLRVLAGSRLAIRGTCNNPVKNTTGADRPFNRVTFSTKNGAVDVPLVAQRGDRQTLVAEVDGNPEVAVPNDAQAMSIHLVDDDGLQTKDPAVYPIDLIPDQPPTVHVTYPDRKEQLSTARAQLIVGVEASDDFALGKLTLCYRVLPPELAETIAGENGAAPAAPEQNPAPLLLGHHHEQDFAPPPPPPAVSDSISLDLKGTPKSFRGQFRFELAKLKTQPLEHGAVEWWLEAEDTNDVTGPGKTSTDHYLTRIGTEEEVRSDLFARLGNHMGEIKEAAETQSQDNADLGQMIQEKVQDKP